MSKYFDWGMPLNEVIRCVTATPAKVLGMEGEVGTLAPGAFGDAVIVDLREQKTTFTDKFGHRLHGEHLFAPVCTVANGNIMWRSIDFLPEE